MNILISYNLIPTVALSIFALSRMNEIKKTSADRILYNL